MNIEIRDDYVVAQDLLQRAVAHLKSAEGKMSDANSIATERVCADGATEMASKSLRFVDALIRAADQELFGVETPSPGA